MNIVIFDKNSLINENTMELNSDQAAHIRKVLKLEKGDFIKIGEKNKNIGIGTIVDLQHKKALIRIEKTDIFPPSPLNTDLVIAMPRPKVARRVIYTATMLGIKKIWLINSAKVEKSYWQSPYIDDNQIERQIILGLEQSCDTVFPEVIKETKFKPFVEDKLPCILENKNGYLLDPYSNKNLPKDPGKEKSILIIGPDGGFIPYENKKIMEAGAHAYSMGTRILRVETAVTAAISRFI